MVKMHKQNILKIVMVFIIVIILSNVVFSLGVAPAKKEIYFEPGLEKEIKLNVFNDQHKDFKVMVYARGELAEYVDVGDKLKFVTADQEVLDIYYKVKLPEELNKPGLHTAEIVIAEVDIPESDENVAVTATVSVISKLKVRVPYPDKYIEPILHIKSENIGGDVFFNIPILNFGELDVESVNALVEVYASNGEKLSEFQTNNISVSSKREGKISGSWKANVNAGIYHAVVTVNYDGKEVTLKKDFEVGFLYVNIKDVVVEDFMLGEVAKFDIYIENMWNQLLEDVYGEMIVIGADGKEYTRFRTANINIGPYEEEVLEAFWSTKDVPIGPYDLNLTIFYEQKNTNKMKKINVNLDSIGVEGFVGRVVKGKGEVNNNAILILVIIILLLANMGWFIYIKRRNVKK